MTGASQGVTVPFHRQLLGPGLLPEVTQSFVMDLPETASCRECAPLPVESLRPSYWGYRPKNGHTPQKGSKRLQELNLRLLRAADHGAESMVWCCDMPWPSTDGREPTRAFHARARSYRNQHLAAGTRTVNPASNCLKGPRRCENGQVRLESVVSLVSQLQWTERPTPELPWQV